MIPSVREIIIFYLKHFSNNQSDYKETLNPTPKAGVRTTAPTPENLKKRAMKETIDSNNFVESFNPTPRSGVRTLAPTPEDLKNVKRMLKDVETSSKSLNPTPKAGVKTLAPTPENLSKRLMKESIDTTDFTGI